MPAGAVFYLPLKQESTAAETGQTLSVIGEITFETVQGIPAAKTDGASYIKTASAFEPSAEGAYTISAWVNFAAAGYAFGIGGSNAGTRLFCSYTDQSSGIGLNVGGTSYESTITYPTGWRHVACVYDGCGSVKLYIDGKLIREDQYTVTISNFDCYVFNSPDLTSGDALEGGGCVSGFRVYNRALTVEEIGVLSGEFVPEVSTSCGFDKLGFPVRFDNIHQAGLNGGNLILLSHFETDVSNASIPDETGNFTLTVQNQGNIKLEEANAKFGKGRYWANYYNDYEGGIILKGLPELDAFTLEYWEKYYGSSTWGGIVLRDTVTGEKLSASKSTGQIKNTWFHRAFVRMKNSAIVSEYINGIKVAESVFTSRFGNQMQWTMGGYERANSYKYADELAIWNGAHYRGDFTPPAEPYVL